MYSLCLQHSYTPRLTQVNILSQFGFHAEVSQKRGMLFSVNIFDLLRYLQVTAFPSTKIEIIIMIQQL
jgi:hypothetical protein